MYGRRLWRRNGRGIWASAGWTPASLSDLILWLDGDLITQASGRVSAWPDLSGHGNHFTQATPANQPTYVAADATFPVAQPAVKFDGSNYHLLGPATLSAAPAWWGVIATYPGTSFTDFDVLLGRTDGNFQLRGDQATANWRTASGNIAGTRYRDRTATNVALSAANAPHVYEFVPTTPSNTFQQILGCQFGSAGRIWRGSAVAIVATSSDPSSEDKDKFFAWAQARGRR